MRDLVEGAPAARRPAGRGGRPHTPRCAGGAGPRTCRWPCGRRRSGRTRPTRASPASTTPTCGCAARPRSRPRCAGAGRACSPSGRSPIGRGSTRSRMPRAGSARRWASPSSRWCSPRSRASPSPSTRRTATGPRSRSTRRGASGRRWWPARSPRTTTWSTRSSWRSPGGWSRDKDVEYRPAADGRGVARVAVPAGRRAVPCLSDEQIKEVARLAQRAERHYGCPQDVEWAIEADPAGGHRLFLLQCRPETVWSRRPARR